MHILQPKHTKISEKESEEFLKKMNISKMQLPKIFISDLGLPQDSKVGDIIKIERKEENKTNIYFRVVV